MKKILSTLAIMAVAGLALTSCNNQPQKNDTAASETKSSVAGKNDGSLKIAYVEVDSIMSQYQYWKDVMSLMKGKQANIEKTLKGKQQSLQQAAANFQRGIQSNKYTQEQAQQIQAGLQKQAQDGDALQQRLGQEYQEEIAKYNQALSDSIHHFLAAYNKDKKYSLILAKQGDNILYAQDALDVTNEIVSGLNKSYKGMKKK